jgi:phospholipase C
MQKVLASALSALMVVSTIPASAAEPATATPIKHVIVIFGENISFDHYFGTYPKSENRPGETRFDVRPGQPAVNNLLTPLDMSDHSKGTPITGLDLLNKNPNGPAGSGAAFNGANAANPFRLSPSQAATADQSHAPKPEQTAYHNGKMDQFPGSTGAAGPPPMVLSTQGAEKTKGLVMGYYDGNTVSALWNYASHFVLFDNTYTSQFGPSTPGAINLISGQTNGIDPASTNIVSGGVLLHSSHEVFDGQGGYTLIGDAEPLGDVCSNTASDNVRFDGKNIGDLLNAQGITWGWFQGGFDLTMTNGNGSTGCARYTTPTVPDYAYYSNDYVEHHQPFQYYASTANLTHARPSSISAIGSSWEADGVTPEPANHQYDTHDFFDALGAGNLPAVTFLKAPAFQDAHPGNSDPIDEQAFIVSVVNSVMQSPFWDSSAIVITYDDSDGWYDHQMPPIVNGSSSSYVDVLNGPGKCEFGIQQGFNPPGGAVLNGINGKPVLGRCGYGTRIPMLVISPYTEVGAVDHTVTDQSSVIAMIENNWLHGERVQPGGSFDTIAGSIVRKLDLTTAKTPAQAANRILILDPNTGQPAAK